MSVASYCYLESKFHFLSKTGTFYEQSELHSLKKVKSQMYFAILAYSFTSVASWIKIQQHNFHRLYLIQLDEWCDFQCMSATAAPRREASSRREKKKWSSNTILDCSLRFSPFWPGVRIDDHMKFWYEENYQLGENWIMSSSNQIFEFRRNCRA